MAIEFRLGKLSDLEAKLDKVSRDTYNAGARALREEAEIEMTEAKARTPVDTGALKGSGRVEGPFTAPEEISVSLVFGGPAAPYALYVHENLEALHPNGQAKYLESVLVESQPYLAQRIAARMKRILGL